MGTDTVCTPSEVLRTLAASVRANPNSREAIAAGFELISAAMEPCIDCGHPDLDDLHTIAPEDNPETGV